MISQIIQKMSSNENIRGRGMINISKDGKMIYQKKNLPSLYDELGPDKMKILLERIVDNSTINYDELKNMLSIAFVESGLSRWSVNFLCDDKSRIKFRGYYGYGAFGCLQLVGSTYGGIKDRRYLNYQDYVNNYMNAEVILNQFDWACSVQKRYRSSDNQLFYSYLAHWQGDGFVNSFRKHGKSVSFLNKNLTNISYQGFVKQMNKLFKIRSVYELKG